MHIDLNLELSHFEFSIIKQIALEVPMRNPLVPLASAVLLTILIHFNVLINIYSLTYKARL